MVNKLSDLEKVLKNLPYKKDADGNPALKYNTVKNLDYFRGLDLNVEERHISDKYPNISQKDYLQLNNLYKDGFFDRYFARQYELLTKLYSLKPENFPKPISVILNDSNKRVGYVYQPLYGKEVKSYMPTSISLRDYLKDYNEWDKKIIAEELRRVTSLEDLIPHDELEKFILKKGISEISSIEKDIKEYGTRIKVYQKRKDEIDTIRKKINNTIKDINSKGLRHNNLNLDNVMIYRDDNKNVEVEFLNPVNNDDFNGSLFDSDKHKLNAINRHLKWAGLKLNISINGYKNKYKSKYPGF